MAAPDTITVAQLSRLIGTPDAPVILDVRIDDDRAADPRALPASFSRDYATVSDWSADYTGRSVAVVCQRIDRIACPWLIRRFIDPGAVFLFVAPSEVTSVAERFGATPFDIEGIFWSHRGDTCTFDAMLDEFSLHSDALLRWTASCAT